MLGTYGVFAWLRAMLPGGPMREDAERNCFDCPCVRLSVAVVTGIAGLLVDCAFALVGRMARWSGSGVLAVVAYVCGNFVLTGWDSKP